VFSFLHKSNLYDQNWLISRRHVVTKLRGRRRRPCRTTRDGTTRVAVAVSTAAMSRHRPAALSFTRRLIITERIRRFFQRDRTTETNVTFVMISCRTPSNAIYSDGSQRSVYDQLDTYTSPHQLQAVVSLHDRVPLDRWHCKVRQLMNDASFSLVLSWVRVPTDYT